MNYSQILDYGRRCQRAKYTHIDNDGDYAIERDGDTAYLLFEWSDSVVDWKNNFDFPTKPYKDMGTIWRCHRGFLKVWKSIEPYIADTVKDLTIKKFVIIGYSHGAAIATFAHEYVWFHRPDLREDGLVGYGFGAPRVYWGFSVADSLKERWANFYMIKNDNDLVTRVPPMIFGFKHVGQIVQINSDAENSIKAHSWDEYEKGIGENI